MFENTKRKIVVINHLSLDGVMQAPGRPDEDRRGGFQHGGWAQNDDPLLGTVMGERMGQDCALLFGRRTYEDFAAFWPKQKDNSFAEALTNFQKYVASMTLREPLPWRNSTLLNGDAMDAVAQIKEQPGGNLVIFGSGVLVQSLMQRNLIDEYMLMIHPLVLGSGRRLFPDNSAPAALRLINSKITTTGIIIAIYAPAELAAGS